MADRQRIQRPLCELLDRANLLKESPVFAGHECMPSPDCPAHDIAKVIARVGPVALDTRLAEKRSSDLAMGGAGDGTIEGLQN